MKGKELPKLEKKAGKPQKTLLHAGICKRCGVPHMWGKDLDIDSDNTTLLPPVRGVFYETEELEHLLGGLEETRRAFPLEHLHYSTQASHKHVCQQLCSRASLHF